MARSKATSIGPRILSRRMLLKTVAATGVTLSALHGGTGSAIADSTDPPAIEWQNAYGGADLDVAWSIIQTADGGYALTGQTGSFGSGVADFWLVKVDENGNKEWTNNYGGSGRDEARGLVQTTDGGYAIVGWSDSAGADATDFFLVRTDSRGNELWQQYYGGRGDDFALSLTLTDDGGFALAGDTGSVSGNGDDFWLVKTDEEGTEEWTQAYGGTKSDECRSVVQTADGGYALAGWTNSFGAAATDFLVVKTDAEGKEEWSQTHGGGSSDRAWSLVQTRDSGYAIAGTTFSFGATGADVWLVKLDDQGNVEWEQTYGDSSSDHGRSVIQTRDGGYAIGGFTDSSAGDSEFWIVKTGPEGVMEWTQSIGGDSLDRAYSVIQTEDQGYALAGRTSSFGAGQSDFWAVKLESEQITVSIDIKPGSGTNPINPRSKGVVPVAILNTAGFEPTATVDIDTLRFGPETILEEETGSMPLHEGHIEDVDDDGTEDLLLHFPIEGTSFGKDDSKGFVTGKTTDGKRLVGSDDVKIL